MPLKTYIVEMDDYLANVLMNSGQIRIVEDDTSSVELEATQLRDGWAVRPKNQLGTMGWHPFPWNVVYVKAPSAEAAIRKAKPEFAAQAEKHGKTIR